MKKTILSLAVLFATSLSFSAFAQTPAPEAASCGEKTECCQNALFEGITLTPDQQTKLQELKASRAKAAKERKEAAKAERKADRIAKGETNKSDRKDYLNSVKGILTPDQYVIFLENAYVNAPAKIGNGKFNRNLKGDMKAHGAKKGKMDHKMKAKGEAAKAKDEKK
ncbi:MAG: hypothetical protein K2K68_00455 [Duncaniella sp.]|nr:hypothetical protein [Duncaniella sp.]